MKKLFSTFFKESMLGSVVIVFAIIFAGLTYLVPILTKETSIKDAYQESQRLVTYIRIFRSYYASDILKKVKEHTDLKINFDHKERNDTIPLPATLVHDLGDVFTQNTDTSIVMYSNYPFPNRADRQLDRFQQDALAHILQNNAETFSREELIDGIQVYRTAFADYLSAPSCVECHNTRADTPKSDWKLGDIRGVIEISIPLTTSIDYNKTLTNNIVLFIMANFFILSLIYFVQLYRKNKKLKEDFTSADKILSEYKRAVDLGAIVSKANKKGIITYVNDAFVEVSGYSKEELIGKSHNIVHHSDTPKELFKQMWKQILNKEVWQGDIKNKRKDGSPYYVYATIVPILDENNEILEFLAIRYDTTNLHNAITQAYIAEKAKSDFLANMSHELRTPLNAIIGFSQILIHGKKLNEKELMYVSKIKLSGENLLTLVNSILDFSKIEEGKMDLHKTSINICELFEEIHILLEMQAKDKNITINIDGVDKQQKLFADKQLIKQAFINILSNGVKFTPQNGEIHIRYKYENERHHFAICDNGVGMSKEDLENLFEPFKQGNAAKENKSQGTGLGMAITKKIFTELHNGEISVESVENEGTCFFVTL
jgi:PAS domain S-box-containing protein